jgi:hypothetical protein
MVEPTAASDVDIKVLMTEYGFFQKAFELQFSHFMGVFYLWTGLIGLPVTAGLLLSVDTADRAKSLRLVVLCLVLVALGWFLSLKMFDIRRSQLRYATRLNDVRVALYKASKIQEKYNLEPYGAGVNLVDTARKDFGMTMATVMALCHGVLAAAAGWLLVSNAPWFAVRLMPLALGLIVCFANRAMYFRFFPRG